MIFLAGTLAVGLVAALGVVGWLAYKTVAAGREAADARVSRASIEAELERAQFETEVTTRALDAAHARAAALEGVLADEITSSPNPDLARDDVRGRILRLAVEWGRADRLPTGASDGVPEAPATAATDAF